MKRVIILILLFTYAGIAFAQKDSIYVWNRSCKRSDTTLLFNTLRNSVCIYSKHINPYDFILKSPDSSFLIDVQYVEGDTLVIENPYYYINKTPVLLIFVKERRLRRLVKFGVNRDLKILARLGTIKSSTASKHNVLAQEYLWVSISDPLYDPNTILQVTSFKFKTHLGNDDIAIRKTGYKITNDITSVIEELPKGASIEFTDIELRGPDSKMRLPDIKIIMN